MKKLKIPLVQSQRDSRWGSLLLGYNSQSQFNIYNYGCLITSFGNYIGKTPIEVNDILKANGGFVSGGGDFIWSKASVLGINPFYTSPRYEDAVSSQGISKMKSLIDEGRPLICEVDFNPNTIQEDQHYVLVIGYDESQEEKFIAIDPWTGTLIDLSVYGGIKRALYMFRAYDKVLPFDTGEEYFLGIDLNNKESIKVCIQMWKDVIDGKYVKKEDCDKRVKDVEDRLNGEIEKKDETINNLNGQINQLKDEKLILSDDLKKCQDNYNLVKDCPNNLIEKTQEYNQIKMDFENYKGSFQEKEINYVKEIKTLKTRLEAFKSPTKKLIVDIWSKFFNNG